LGTEGDFMKMKYLLFFSILALTSWNYAANAGPWDMWNGIHLSPDKLNLREQKWETVSPPSPITVTGHLSNFTVAFDERNQNFDCRASLTAENGSSYLLRFNAVPAVMEEVYSQFFLSQQAALCQSAQRAYLGDQRISVTGLVETPANQDSFLAVQRYAPLPPEEEEQSVFSNAGPEMADICNLGVCNARGALVTSVTYQLGMYPLL